MKKNILISSIKTAILMMTGVQAHALPVIVLPENGTFRTGDGTVTINPAGDTMTIGQTSNSAVIDWNSFNIGQDGTVAFNTPNSGAVTLNIINGGARSDIHGTLTSNGQLFLFNKNGFLFGANSSVNAAGFMALSNENPAETGYNDDNRTLTLGGDGGGNIKIERGATITAASGGYIALIAPGIDNAGILTANDGNILLTSQNTGTLIVPGINQRIGFDISSLSGTSAEQLINSGDIIAHNGFVTLSNHALDTVSAAAINNSGIIDIRIQNAGSGGAVLIEASNGTLVQSGDITAEGGSLTLASNNIRIAGNNLQPVNLTGETIEFRKGTGETNPGNLMLQNDTTMIAGRAIDLSQFNITGSGESIKLSLQTTGDSADTPSISLNGINNIGRLSAVTQGGLTLNGDIQVVSETLTLTADTIYISNNIRIANNAIGSISLQGTLTSANAESKKSLILQNLQGDVHFGSANNIEDLTIINRLGNTSISGNINVEGTFDASQSVNVYLRSDVDEIIAHDIKLGTTLQSDAALSMKATSVELGPLQAPALTVDTSTLILNGDITTHLNGNTTTLDLGKVGRIELAGNSILTGNLNLTSNANTANIYNRGADNAYSLGIVTNSGLTIGEIGTSDNRLSSVSIQGNGVLQFSPTGNSLPIFTRGSNGISVLGNMTTVINNELTFDTSRFNGDLNLTGLTINGNGKLTFNTGSGDLSLGNIGQSSPIASLHIESASNLNLHGSIRTSDNKLDFSNTNSITLHSNQTWGSNLTPYDINLGNSSIDGTYNLTIHASALNMTGRIGSNQALQNLNINLNNQTLDVVSSISIAGNMVLKANQLILQSMLYSSGGSIDIQSNNTISMNNGSQINALNGSVNMISHTGDIRAGIIQAANSIRLTATNGSILNNINDYRSDKNNTINLKAPDIQLSAGRNIGTSTQSPIVVAAGRQGNINAQSPGNIFIANLDGSSSNISGKAQDISRQTQIAAADATLQLNVPAYHATQKEQNSELVDPLWNTDKQEETEYGSPRIYQDRQGIRLGNPR